MSKIFFRVKKMYQFPQQHLEEIVLTTNKLPDKFEGGIVVQYMEDRNRAVGLVKACLDSPAKGSTEIYPLSDLLYRDTRIPRVKGKSIAYTYAFRSLLRTPLLSRKKYFTADELSTMWQNSTNLNTFLDEVEFRPGFLARIFFIDSPEIVASFPLPQDDIDYKLIAGSTYVRALSRLFLKEEYRETILIFLRFQLLFPSSPASVVAHYIPLIGSKEDIVYLDRIGEISKYTNEIIWIMGRILVEGYNAKDADNQSKEDKISAFETLTGDLMSITNYFPSNDAAKIQSFIRSGVERLGIPKEKINAVAYQPFADKSINNPHTEQVRQKLSFLTKMPLGDMGNEEVMSLMRNIIAENDPSTKDVLQALRNEISEMYEPLLVS